MNDNRKEPAFPVNHTPYEGRTKREYFAGLAMQGLLADQSRTLFPAQYAEMAVECADALLAELAKEQKP